MICICYCSERDIYDKQKNKYQIKMPSHQMKDNCTSNVVQILNKHECQFMIEQFFTKRKSNDKSMYVMVPLNIKYRLISLHWLSKHANQIFLLQSI